MYAAYNGNLAAAQTLLANKADVNATDDCGFNALGCVPTDLMSDDLNIHVLLQPDVHGGVDAGAGLLDDLGPVPPEDADLSSEDDDSNTLLQLASQPHVHGCDDAEAGLLDDLGPVPPEDTGFRSKEYKCGYCQSTKWLKAIPLQVTKPQHLSDYQFRNRRKRKCGCSLSPSQHCNWMLVIKKTVSYVIRPRNVSQLCNAMSIDMGRGEVYNIATLFKEYPADNALPGQGNNPIDVEYCPSYIHEIEKSRYNMAEVKDIRT